MRRTRHSRAAVRLVLLAGSCLLAGLRPGWTQTNLLTNGGFETGRVAPWAGVADASLDQVAAQSGQWGLHLRSAQLADQGWVQVVPGRLYVVTAWFKWTSFAGPEWGYDTIVVTGLDWQTEARIISLHDRYEQGRWHKLALTFTARTSAVRVGVGVYGPKQTVDLAFDDVRLTEKSGNAVPSVAPTASAASGTAPLSVTFAANADDGDGAVAAYRWEFGDGSAATTNSPTHRFISRGGYDVRLTVWDNEGASATGVVHVDVASSLQPSVTITQPTSDSTYVTGAAQIVLAGTAVATGGRAVSSLVWDNLATDEADVVPVQGASSAAWSTPGVRLRPGVNEILLTVTDSAGAIATTRLTVTRTLSQPLISNIVFARDTVKVYEKFEVHCDVDTVADTVLFRFDDAPPPGVPSGAGITFEAVFEGPGGTRYRQPGYWHQEVVRTETNGKAHFAESARGRWVVRFAPREVGTYTVTLRARDRSGTAEISAGTFVATAPARPGFIGVSREDPRYFEFSNQTLFFPVGPARGPDYARNGGAGLNLERVWMGGMAAYSTDFSRWMRVDKVLGNEGFDSPLTSEEHYPSHEIARELIAPGAHRIWMGLWGDDLFYPRLKPGAEYVVKLRAKTVALSGPADPSFPYGLVIKVHGFPGATIEADLLRKPSLIPRASVERDWHTIVVRYRPTDAEAAEGYLSLSLENVTQGRAYIDQFSMREVLPDGSLGGELIRHSRADLHTYVESRAAAYFDWQVEQGETSGVWFKYVVHDKRDWIADHLVTTGSFQPFGDGYFQPAGTKARWLIEQWWRYLAARWGYSTAIHSWELCNEASPDDPLVYRMTQDFAKFMRENDAHPHLSTTSFWCCWKPDFWGDRITYPDVGYADLHEYTDNPAFALDVAEFVLDLGRRTSAPPVKRPVIVGETGIGSPGHPYFEPLRTPNAGIWYHNLLWAQLGASGLSAPNYWWSEHLDAIDPRAVAAPFSAFMKSLDLNRGGYEPIGATVSNPQVRAAGQKVVAGDAAHVWVQNRLHTWRNVMGVVGAVPVVAQSATVTLRMRPSTQFVVERWNTYRGSVDATSVASSDATGNLVLTVAGLQDDVAFRVTGPRATSRPSAPARLRTVPH